MRIDMPSHGEHETKALGKCIGRLLEAGDVVCLYGELGSGKTTFTKGLAKGLGVENEDVVRSPSFVLIHRYTGRMPVYHIDLFRLDMPGSLDDVGVRDLLGGEGVVIVEWAERLAELLPRERLDMMLQYGDDVDTRQITLQPQGARYIHLLKPWQAQASDTHMGPPHCDRNVHGGIR